MSKTIQKRIKFSKGEVNSLLAERTDLDLLDNSGSYIKNYIPTIYGGFKTRHGTKNILKINFTDKININSINSTIGGDTNNFIKDIKFISTLKTNINSNLLQFNYNNEYINFLNINNIKYNFAEAEVKLVLEDLILEEITYKTIKEITIVDGGLGYKNPSIKLNSTEIIELANFTIELNDLGTITNIIINSGGAYSDNVFIETITRTLLETTLNIKVNDSLLQTIVVNEEAKDFLNILINQNVNNIIIESTDEVNSSLELGNFNSYKFQEQAKNTKIIPFIFDNDLKFLILVSQTEINIIKNDINIQKITLASNLQINNLNILKYSQNENLIVFTENTRPPKQLKRNSDDSWTFGLFALQNIPVYAFDGEKTNNNDWSKGDWKIKPSATEGSFDLKIEGSNVNYFTSAMVGQIIDGNGGRFRITEYKSKTQVFGYTIIPFYTTETFQKFKYINGFTPVWSEAKGYPNSCLFYQERLWFGGSKLRPLTIWASRLNQFNDFNNIGNYDGDSINIDISSKENNCIVNLYGNRGLQIFSGGAEFIASEGSLTPDSISVVQTSSVGSKAVVEPFDIAGTTVFIDKKGLNLNSFVYNENQATYNSNAITLLNNQVMNNPVSLAIDYNSNFEDGNFIYIVNEDGTIALANILLEQGINAFTRLITNNGKIIDCVNLGDAVYFLVSRNEQIFLEKLINYKTDFTIIKTLNNTNIINDLQDYNNLIVRVYSSNIDYGTYRVINGTIALNETITDTVFIGLDIDCELSSNNISINGQTNNIKSRIAQAVITTHNTDILNFNNQKQKSNKNIFYFNSCSNWEIENKFTIKTSFDYNEIKSIVLYINYGK